MCREVLVQHPGLMTPVPSTPQPTVRSLKPPFDDDQLRAIRRARLRRRRRTQRVLTRI